MGEGAIADLTLEQGERLVQVRGRYDQEAWQKTLTNLDKWGDQPLADLLICMMEELGELSQAYLQYASEQAPKERMKAELQDLNALIYQFAIRYEGVLM